MIELIILFFLILLNAFIVMCEMALVSAKKNRLETTAVKGDRKSRIALELKENPEIFIYYTNLYYPYCNLNRCLFRRKIQHLPAALS